MNVGANFKMIKKKLAVVSGIGNKKKRRDDWPIQYNEFKSEDLKMYDCCYLIGPIIKLRVDYNND